MPEDYPLVSYHTWDSKLSLARLTLNNNSQTTLSPGFQSPISPALSSVPLRQHIFAPRHDADKTRPHLKAWQFEIFASVVSVLTLMGLMIMLAKFDQRQYHEWAWEFTLNGVVAVLSTICHTALMVPIGSAISQAAWLYYLPAEAKKVKLKDLEHFETFNDASRGAFGSLKLLWQIRGRNLVAIGAILTILALGFDTFTQQVVSLRSSSITGGDASLYFAGEVPRSSYENGYDHGSTFSSFIPTLNTRAAIYNGILAQDIQPPTVPCSTGNCTWPIIPSLAVCGECTPSSFTTSCNATYCNYTMPTGTTFSSPVQQRTQNPLFQVTNLNYGGSTCNYSSTTIAYLAVFDAIGAPWSEIYADNSSVTATECGLWMCVQAYHISSSNSFQTHSTIGNFSSIIPFDSSSVTGNRTFEALPENMNPIPGQNFTIYGLSLVSTANGLSALEGTVEGGVGTKYYSTDFIESIWNNTSTGTLDPWIKRLALSMTNNLRTNTDTLSPPSNSTTAFYAGTAYHNQLFISVRWAWLTLPIFLVVASLLFLIGSIIRSAQSGVEVFKGSPLALLFSEIDGSIKERLRRTGSAYGLGLGKAGKTRVVLRSEEGKWLFKEA